ncbi:hypothetical protein SAMN05216188_103268 [Lentzea xinjiangensis]|uniref:DoxX-like family protein n=1 Tax=Lentzea xinjiangensis TaxID=402600 RepID=A0A1H9GKY8_9PSEU|nr:hypothetical protein [Lentzea xinjiangensis]SEQ50786.1 hypothetical protein SAMN05216188_103268 [Lentzea xinjiangensis]
MKPVEVRVASAVAFGGALVFLVVGLVLWRSTGDADVLKLPSFTAAVELAVAAALLLRMRVMHYPAMIVFILVALLHLVITLADGPAWTRAASGVLAAVHLYGVVLLNTGPAREHLGGPR